MDKAQMLASLLQGASNSAASNVSAPIDGINWLLRKAGLPVSDRPFLGSDWMAEKGLTAQPKNKNMGLLGEAIGAVAPIVAAAKAPQIAKGLLQMSENAAIPQTLSKEAGVVGMGNKPLTRDQFRSRYAQHIDLHNRIDSLGADRMRQIQEEGFRVGFGPNAMPPYMGGEPTDIIGKKFAPRSGDVVYLVPKDGWKSTPSGIKITPGWKPSEKEIVKVSEDYQDMYQAYLNSLKDQ